MSITTTVNKEEVFEALKSLPEENALPEALERLYILYKIQKGIEAAEEGNTISHEEAKQRLRKWLV